MDKTIRTINFLQKELNSYNKKNRIFATSSFQTQSVPLLHLLSINFPEVAIIFLDTGFLFPETYGFKKELTQLFNLKIIELKSSTNLIQQRNGGEGFFEFSIDTDRCCNMNKVQPLEDFLNVGDVWISGIRKDQTNNRAQMKPKTAGINNTLRLHPMLEWTESDIYQYIKLNDLPKHPLEDRGYKSIGCVPCTRRETGKGRSDMRWLGSKKTECGLHLKSK